MNWYRLASSRTSGVLKKVRWFFSSKYQCFLYTSRVHSCMDYYFYPCDRSTQYLLDVLDWLQRLVVRIIPMPPTSQSLYSCEEMLPLWQSSVPPSPFLYTSKRAGLESHFFGVVNIRSRTKRIGASFTCQSKPGTHYQHTCYPPAILPRPVSGT